MQTDLGRVQKEKRDVFVEDWAWLQSRKKQKPDGEFGRFAAS